MIRVSISELRFLCRLSLLFPPQQFLVILLYLQFSSKCKSLPLANAPHEGLRMVTSPRPVFRILIFQSDRKNSFTRRSVTACPPPCCWSHRRHGTPTASPENHIGRRQIRHQAEAIDRQSVDQGSTYQACATFKGTFSLHGHVCATYSAGG